MSHQIEPFLLVIRNFLSYGNNYTYIPLNFKKPTLIVGRNLDHSVEGQIDSNGAGKSVILNAISVATYGKTIGNRIKVDDLVNWVNEKNMEVGFHFRKDKEWFYIERYRKNAAKGGDGTRLLRAPAFNKALDGYQDVTVAGGKIDEEIEKIIGMPFDVFSRIILYSSSHPSFFDLPTTSTKGVSQSSIMEELFNLVELSESAERLKKQMDVNKLSIKELSALQEVISAELIRHKEQLNGIHESVQEWDREKLEKIKKAEHNLKTVEGFDFEDNRRILGKIAKLDELLATMNRHLAANKESIETHKKKELQKLAWDKDHVKRLAEVESTITDLSKINFAEQKVLYTKLDSIIQERTTYLNENIVLKKDLDSKTLENEKLADEVAHLHDNKCPYCLQNYEDAKTKVKDNVTKIKALTKEINTITKKMDSHSTKSKEINDSIQEIRSNLVFNSPDEATRKESLLLSSKEKLDTISKELNPYSIDELNIDVINKEIETESKLIESTLHEKDALQKEAVYSNERDLTLAESKVDSFKTELTRITNEENPHTKTLAKLQTAKLPVSKQEELDILLDDFEHQEFLYKLLTKKDSFIRKTLMAKNLTYLNQMLKYYREKLGLAYGVNFNYDMSVSITYLKKKISYEQISTGQRARLNIALWAAFRKVREKRYGTIPFCMVDEALDTGLGNVGVQNAAKMFKTIAADGGISMFVISHRDEIAQMFDSKLEVEFENKFSHIVKSDINVEEVEA